MTDTEGISGFRSEVIERTINIEWLVGSIVCQHYFGKIYLPFLLEVLYDEYFSFALKRRILEKIIPDLDKKQLQNLNRVNTIRNYFAHCNTKFFLGNKKPQLGEKGKILDPKNTEKELDFENLHKEFELKECSVKKALYDLAVSLGLKVYEEPSL